MPKIIKYLINFISIIHLTMHCSGLMILQSNTPVYGQTPVRHSVYFATDSSCPNISEKNQLMNIVSNLDNSDTFSVSIFGYCDETGEQAYNYFLSTKRARCVKDLLLSRLNKLKINQIEGKGELPISDTGNCDTEKLKTLNRRVDVVFTKNEGLKTMILAPTTGRLEITHLSENLKVGDKVILKNILFVGGRRDFLPESYSALDTLAAFLLRNRHYHILIIGHICCQGGDLDGIDLETGLRNLSVVRARMVYKFLINKGIHEKLLTYKGEGGKFPLGGDVKYDRRVEIEITGIDK